MEANNIESNSDNLPNYRRSLVENVVSIGESFEISVNVPQSNSCPGLLHRSPTDFTLSAMQAAYELVGRSFPDMPEEYKYNALFLSHRAHYYNQDVQNVVLRSELSQTHSGLMTSVKMRMNQDATLDEMLFAGIPHDFPEPLYENMSTKLIHTVSPGEIDKTLDIYSGERQSDILDVATDGETFEAIVHFPQYSEVAELDHVSAKQMIEALMKAALCGAGYLANRGSFPLDYDEFLTNRLNFRTLKHSIKYRKLLAPRTRSRIEFSFKTEGNMCRVQYHHIDGVFASGTMDFYLPNSSSDIL